MNSLTPGQKDSLYFQRVKSLIETHGKAEEKQLLSRWQRPLQDFLLLASPALLSGRQKLEIGVQSTLALKLNLKTPTGLPGGASLLPAFTSGSVLEPWADLALRFGLRCHMGIKCTPEAFSRELYIYLATPEHSAAAAALNADAAKLLAMRSGLFIGMDDTRGASIYYTADNSSYLEQVANELGIEAGKMNATAIQQIRMSHGIMAPGKSGIDFNPLTPEVLARLLSRYPLPWFRYLFRGAKLSSGFFGGDHATREFSLYANVT